MARDGYDPTPDVEAHTAAPDDTQHIEASPAAFGAGVAAAGEELSKDAIDATKFYGRVAADDGANNTLQQVGSILNGAPGKTVQGPDGAPVQDTGFLGKRGADAMSSWADTQKAVDQVIADNRKSLSTPEAQYQYDVDTRRYRAEWIRQIGEHSDQQQRVWAKDTNDTTAALAMNDLGAKPTDPSTVTDATTRLTNAYVKNAQLAGESTDGAILKAQQEAAITRVRSLIVKDPASAQKVLDENADKLGSLSNYDQISRQVKGAVIDATMAPAIDKAVASATAEATQTVAGGAPSPNSIGNVRAGAHSFLQPATPVDGVNVAASNLRSGYRGLTIQQIAEKWAPKADGNDPAAWAAKVSHAAGLAPGAVPNLDDPTQLAAVVRGIGVAEKSHHELGAFTPDVVQKGVAAALSGQKPTLNGPQGGQYPSTADALNANMDRTLAKAQKAAEGLFPNYPDAQDRYVEGVRRRLDQTVGQQQKQYEVDTHTVQAVMSSDHPPISEDELLATSPQVAQSWRSMQVNNPYGAMSVERMFDANAKGKAVTYGSQFKNYLDRVLAPTTDTDRISNPQQLWPYVGPGESAALTNTGVAQLTDILGQRGTPQGEAFASQVKGFADNMHAQLTFSNKGTGVYDAKGEAAYSKFMAQALPVLVKSQKSGNLAAALNPKSPDYIGNLAQTFMRTPAQVTKDRLEGIGSASQLPAYTPQTLAHTLDQLDNDDQRREALKAAVAQKRISLTDATQIGINRGYIQGSSPEAPLYVGGRRVH